MVANHRCWLAALRHCATVCALTLPLFSASSVSLAMDKAVEFSSEADAAFAEMHESAVISPESAKFDQWEGVCDESDLTMGQEELLPFDWARHFGFRHSSTSGRNVGKGIPLEGASWLNRPYHVDWFLGPLLGDQLTATVRQDNVLFGGLRIGWDFDYFWGVEWRFGWADPRATYAEPLPQPVDVSYVVSDVDLLYYPWGDAKVRPYFLVGVGATQLDFIDDQGQNHHATLATLPLGGGVQFHQWPWLVWRIEFLNNLAFGADDISTMNNVSLTAGMELRLGARPASYWPWRSSRTIW
jgi:hypothetical protein